MKIANISVAPRFDTSTTMLNIEDRTTSFIDTLREGFVNTMTFAHECLMRDPSYPLADQEKFAIAFLAGVEIESVGVGKLNNDDKSYPFKFKIKHPFDIAFIDEKFQVITK